MTVGEKVGEFVGLELGETVGVIVGVEVGEKVGDIDGVEVGVLGKQFIKMLRAFYFQKTYKDGDKVGPVQDLLLGMLLE